MRNFAPWPIAVAVAAAAPAAPPAYRPELNARLFDRIWSTVERNYWDRPAVAALWPQVRAQYRDRVIAARDRRTVYALLGEMLATFGDSHVYAIDPVQLSSERRHLHGEASGGFGFTLRLDDQGLWRVTGVRTGGPAAAAGIEIGWVLQQVGGAPVDADYLPHPGEVAIMRFLDEDSGRQRIVSLTARLEPPLPLRRAEMLADGVLHIGFDGFDPGVDRWIAHEIASRCPRAVILDLRENGGGDADVVARIAGLFFDRDRLLIQRKGAHVADQWTLGAGRHSFLGPLAVLVGPNSASAAEALAALVDESGRGITVGDRTAGALTGAAYHHLPDGGRLAVAEFDIRTPQGHRLEGLGLAPRIPVALTYKDRRAGRDPVLSRAGELVATGMGQRHAHDDRLTTASTRE